MRGWTIATGCIGMLLLLPIVAQAQIPPPFIGGGATAFDPVVGVIESGALLDAQATVSADRKYVTITIRGDSSRLRALVPFPVVTTEQLGFVGGAPLPGGTPPSPPNVSPTTPPRGSSGMATSSRGTAAAAGAARNALPATPSPDQISRNAKAWILSREGMFLLRPLE